MRKAPEHFQPDDISLLATMTRQCRICGCTDYDCSGCIERTGSPCSWIKKDLCSACYQPQTNESKENQRRYYLHRRLIKAARIRAQKRIIQVSEKSLDAFTESQIRYFLELQIKHNYTIQYEIN